MSRQTLRLFAYFPLALPLLAGAAAAGVGDMSAGGLSSFGRLSSVQAAQYSGDCWYDDGWNGPGYYPCGDESNSGFGGAGPVGPIIVPTIRRRHHHGVVVAHPQPNPIYRGAGVPSGRFHAAAAPAIGASAVGPGWRRLGVGGARVSPNFHPGGATVTPGFAGGGFHGSLGGGNFHQFHSAGIPHIGAPAAPRFTGVGGFHPGSAIGTPHIGAPASPGFARVGTFHGAGGVGTPHIGAPASPGLSGGGFHGVGGAGVFQGGIGHR